MSTLRSTTVVLEILIALDAPVVQMPLQNKQWMNHRHFFSERARRRREFIPVQRKRYMAWTPALVHQDDPQATKVLSYAVTAPYDLGPSSSRYLAYAIIEEGVTRKGTIAPSRWYQHFGSRRWKRRMFHRLPQPFNVASAPPPPDYGLPFRSTLTTVFRHHFQQHQSRMFVRAGHRVARPPAVAPSTTSYIGVVIMP